MDTNAVQREIEAALKELPIRAGRESRIPGLVPLFLQATGPIDGLKSRKFRVASAKTCREQLERIATLFDKLEAAMTGLYGSAVDALADEGILAAEQIPVFQKAALQAKAAASQFAPNQQTPATPRLPDRGAQAIARLVAYAYTQLTGRKRITLSKSKAVYSIKREEVRFPVHGDFMRLMTRIFAILQPGANAEHYAAWIAKQVNDPISGENALKISAISPVGSRQRDP